MAKTIATGSASTEEQALAWLRAHGAHITSGGVVDIIELPKEARVERDGYDWRYCIWFYGPDGNDEPQYVEIELNVDVTETILRLKGEAPEPEETEGPLPPSTDDADSRTDALVEETDGYGQAEYEADDNSYGTAKWT